MATSAPAPGDNPGLIDSPRIRQGGRELLSLALMDARNHTLHLLTQFEQSLPGGALTVPFLPTLNPPLWELGHLGWFQERWIGRNLLRHLGDQCDPRGTLLPSIEASADRWWDSGQVAHASRWQLDLPDVAACRQYLLQTLESTLELLERAEETDQGLYFYRLCLFHEDMHAEALVNAMQTLGLSLDRPLLKAFSPPPEAAREA